MGRHLEYLMCRHSVLFCKPPRASCSHRDPFLALVRAFTILYIHIPCMVLSALLYFCFVESTLVRKREPSFLDQVLLLWVSQCFQSSCRFSHYKEVCLCLPLIKRGLLCFVVKAVWGFATKRQVCLPWSCRAGMKCSPPPPPVK